MTAKTLKMKVDCETDVLNTALPPHSKDGDAAVDGGGSRWSDPAPERRAATIYEFWDMFSSGSTNMGRTGLVKHTIDTGDQQSICLPPRRLLIAKHEIEQEKVQKMLGWRVIEPCQSNCASPVVLVTKKDRTKRFCMDYRNWMTSPGRTPILWPILRTPLMRCAALLTSAPWISI